jgi:hypothetical protein
MDAWLVVLPCREWVFGFYYIHIRDCRQGARGSMPSLYVHTCSPSGTA